MVLFLLSAPRVIAVQMDKTTSVWQSITTYTEFVGPPEPTGRANVVRWIEYWSLFYRYKDTKKAEAIVSCEGGFDNPSICNTTYGCSSGQGHAQFIPSTWSNIQKKIGVENVFNTSDNIKGLIYLLSTDGDKHWRPYSGSCWIPKL